MFGSFENIQIRNVHFTKFINIEMFQFVNRRNLSRLFRNTKTKRLLDFSVLFCSYFKSIACIEKIPNYCETGHDEEAIFKFCVIILASLWCYNTWTFP